MHEIITYEEALRKYQRIESNDTQNAMSIEKILEEAIDMMQKNIYDLS